jgi:hypothetical protein
MLRRHEVSYIRRRPTKKLGEDAFFDSSGPSLELVKKLDTEVSAPYGGTFPRPPLPDVLYMHEWFPPDEVEKSEWTDYIDGKERLRFTAKWEYYL